MLPGDDEHTLDDRIKPVERRLLIDVVRRIATGELDLAARALSNRAHPRPTPDPPRSTHGRPQPRPVLYRDRNVVPVRRALVSVSDKTDLLRLAEALDAAGVEIVSTGSTAPRSGMPATR